jgi:hypothetical protein
MVDHVAVVMVTVMTCMCCCPRGNHLDNRYLRDHCYRDHPSEPCLCFPMLHIHAREAHTPYLVLEPIKKIEA